MNIDALYVLNDNSVTIAHKIDNPRNDEVIAEKIAMAAANLAGKIDRAGGVTQVFFMSETNSGWKLTPWPVLGIQKQQESFDLLYRITGIQTQFGFINEEEMVILSILG